MANNDYIFLHDINGNPIKPVTDLAAINMTTTNGIHVEQLNGGTIGIQTGYIESAYYTEMVDPAVGPARPGESYIEGGTMYTLLGGYTVSQNVPGPNPSPYMVPSEAAVREAIDAYVATGGTDIVPGYGITVSGGSISVKAGAHIVVDSTGVSVPTATDESQGVVELRNTVYSMKGGDAVVPTINAVANALTQKQDNLTFDTTTGIDTVGGTTVTNNIGTVEEVLTGSTGADIVTAENLRGALSVGQAVDVSCVAGYGHSDVSNGYATEIKYGEHDWLLATVANMQTVSLNDFLNGFLLRFTYTGSATHQYMLFGWANVVLFPKRAPGLKYLIIADVENIGANPASRVQFSGGTVLTSAPTLAVGASARVASIFMGDTGTAMLYPDIKKNQPVTFSITNWRQYEVTALTDEAIAYIAQLPDPDAFFRSTSAYSIRDKYLVKQDMVCPFIPTIEMSNSDLTVAAGLSYKMTYNSTTAATRTITADTIPDNGYGWDTHLQLFVNDKTTVVFKPPLVLMDPLTVNAGQNMTIKWRNGQALAYVDDRDVGYVVSVASGTTAGTLAYGFTDETGEYVVFSNTLDGTPVELTGTIVPVSRVMSIVGNGNDKTIITGATVSMGRDQVMNVTDVTWKCDLVSTAGNYDYTANFTNCVLTEMPANTSEAYGISFTASVSTLTNCEIVGNSGSYHIAVGGRWINCKIHGNTASSTIGSPASMKDCEIYDNAGNFTDTSNSQAMSRLLEDCYWHDNSYNTAMSCYNSFIAIKGCTFSNNTGYISCIVKSDGTRWSVLEFRGTNKLDNTFYANMRSGRRAAIAIEPGAVLDLSGNTNTQIGIDNPSYPGGYFYVGTYERGSGAGNITLTESGTASVIPYGGGDPVTISGSGNTLLNNGKLGFLVKAISGTTSGTLYDALVGGGTAYSNIIFDPALDGQTVSATNFTMPAKYVNMCGNGSDKTILSITNVTGNGDYPIKMYDCSLTGSLHGMPILLTDCLITGMTSTGSIGSDTAMTVEQASGCTFTGCRANSSRGVITLRPRKAVGDGTFRNCHVINCYHNGDPNNPGPFMYAWANANLVISGSTFTNSYGVNAYANSGPSVTIEDCLFTGSTGNAVLIGAGTATVITGSTFATSTDTIYTGATGRGFTFSGTNILNSTISGAGTVAFADGATVTSVIPDGSTIGTGVFSTAMNCTGIATLENVTVTGATAKVLFSFTGACDLTLNNVIITGNTITDDGDILGLSGTSSVRFISATVGTNTGRLRIYSYSPAIYATDSTFSSDLMTGTGALILSGDNTAGRVRTSKDGAGDNGKIVFTPGSITRVNSAEAYTYTHYYVGTYTPGVVYPGSGTVNVEGTATVVISGVTHTISGSGATLDSMFTD